jgi:biopolymer transport protein ExbD
MKRRSILQRRIRRRVKKDFELQLTSMMDMLIILVVFLLKSYATNSTAFATSSNINLPTSTAEELPADSVNLVIDPTNIVLDGEKIVDFKLPPQPEGAPPIKAENATYELEPHLLGDGGRRILPLFDALVKTREKTELLMSKAVWKDQEGKTTPPKFQGAVIIHADKAIRYDLLRKIMYTAGAAQFKIFKFVTVRKDEA